MTGQRYASEVAFAQAVRLDRQGAPSDQVVRKLGEAVSFNRFSDVYYLNLSQALLLRTRDVLRDPKTRTENGQIAPERASQIQSLLAASMNATARATTLAPNNSLNWLVRGNTYAEVITLVNGAEDGAAASYQKAMELEPKNPLYQANLGRLHLMVADRARSLKGSENKEVASVAVEAEKTELKAAEESLNKAVELKPDYAVAHYYLAAVYERQGRTADAAGRLAALRQYSPLDVGLGFQLSMLFIKLQQYDAARAELERVVGLSPNYSNARWYLASMYEIKGDLSAAIGQIEKVLELNPENQAVKSRLERLKTGNLTTKIPQPVEEEDENATSLEGGEITSAERTNASDYVSEE